MSKQNIFILKSSGGLKNFTSNIKSMCNETTSKAKRRLPLHDIDIVFYISSDETIEELGIGGYSPTAHTILIYLNPDFSDFDKTINEYIKRILAHELYHCMRWKNPGYGNTLLEALISEGLADHFDIEINKTEPIFWNLALTAEQITSIKEKAEKDYNNKKYNHYEWFYGSNEKSIPKYAGYALGFKIVGDYLKLHPDKRPSNIYAVRAEEFLK